MAARYSISCSFAARPIVECIPWSVHVPVTKVTPDSALTSYKVALNKP